MKEVVLIELQLILEFYFIKNMKNPRKTTVIKRRLDEKNGHPLKIVTGKKNCAILRIENASAQRLLESLESDKRYNEFIILSPFTKDGIEFARILFLDADYVKRNEKYILGFDSIATIAYNRGVITLIGDEMWKGQQVASKTSSKIGEAGLKKLNIGRNRKKPKEYLFLLRKKKKIKNEP